MIGAHLTALANQNLPPGTMMCVVVVANGCTDGTAEHARSAIAAMPPSAHVRWRVIDLGQQRGKTIALNHGIGLTRSPLVFVTDSDTLPERSAIPELIRVFTDPQIMVTGAVVENRIPKCLVDTPLGALYRTRQINCSFIGPYPLPTGPLMGFRREAYDRIGPYDEQVVASEDTRFVFEVMRRYGLSAVKLCLTALVTKTPPLTYAELLQQEARWGQNAARMIAAAPWLAPLVAWRNGMFAERGAASHYWRTSVAAAMTGEGIPRQILTSAIPRYSSHLQLVTNATTLTSPTGLWTPVSTTKVLAA